MKGRYIDPIFCGNQKHTWTGDEVDFDAGAAWHVHYGRGSANWAHLDGFSGYFGARPVRLW